MGLCVRVLVVEGLRNTNSFAECGVGYAHIGGFALFNRSIVMGIRRMRFHVASLNIAICVALALLGAAPLARAQNPTTDIDEMGKRIEPSMVTIKTDTGLGSGFVVDAIGLVMTNYHVIEGAKKAVVEFPADKDKKAYPVEGFMAILQTRDLALIKVNAGSRKLAALKVAGKVPNRGEWVATFGSPLGLALTASDGKISAIRLGSELVDMTKRGPTSVYEELGYDPKSTWLQHTAPISHGNSGGPLVNSRAEVVGINTWILPEGQNLSFAIASPHIRDFIAAAPKTMQPLSNLPAPKEHRPTSPDKGDPVATFSIWTQLNRAKNTLDTKLADSENKLEQIPALDPRNPPRAQNVRNKKVSKVFKQMAKDYAEYAKKVKSLKNENADVELIKMILKEGNIMEKVGTAYQELGDAVLLQGGSRQPELATADIKSHLADLRTNYDLLRVNLSRKYGKQYPTLEDTAKEAESASNDNPKKDDTAANEAGGRKGASSADSGKRSSLRTWTDRSGKHHIEARFRGMEDGKAKLEKADGTILRVAPASLSEADRSFIGEE